jgi:hypothetical protein
MRVSQIRSLTWAGNALALGVVVWTGGQFWHARSAHAAPPSAWKSGTLHDVGEQRWPGERSAFEVILTPVDGALPLPPQAPTPTPDLDPVQSFKSKLQYLAGLLFPDAPETSLAFVRFDGKEMWLRPGDAVGASGFRLIEFEIARRCGAEALPGLVTLSFSPPGGGDTVTVSQPDPWGQRLLRTDGDSLVRPPEDLPAIQWGRAPEKGPLARTAYTKPNGEWVITDEEQLWIEVWGEKHVLPHLGMRPETDASGNPRGARITALPESKTPLAPSHGLHVGDVVKSIDGVAVHSKDEILEYLRGPGRGRGRYVVAVELNGAEREVVYRVPRGR